MKPGTHVLNLIASVPLEGRTIVLIRHAERDSFLGVPPDQCHTVGLTPQGIRMARDFGASVRQIAPEARLLLGHTIAKRCEMTARSIRDGFSLDGQARILGCEPEIPGPVADMERLVSLKDECGWPALIERWLDSKIPEEIIGNPRKYSDELLATLLSYPGMRDGEMLVVVAHDMTLFPLVFGLFGKNARAIEFLNGVVISADRDTAAIRFENAEYSLETERKIP